MERGRFGVGGNSEEEGAIEMQVGEVERPR